VKQSAAPAPPSVAGGLVLAATGSAALLLRLSIAALPTPARVVSLAAISGAILVASLLVPVPAGVRRIHPAIALAVGMAGVGVAAFAAGRPAGVPFSPWALPLSILAAAAEEALFRRAAYGAIDARLGAAAAIGGTAVLFALVHVPLYGVAAFPVDLGAGLLLGWQRWASGNWTVPAATHAAANVLAVLAR